jgi:hypothetical protein
MFSVGIFTTHLPYIAIVAFYAYFLIFGTNLASNENTNTESFLTIEIDSDNFNIDACYHAKYYVGTNKNIHKTATLENHVFKRKLKHPDFIYSHYRQECFCYTCISRPPPIS